MSSTLGNIKIGCPINPRTDLFLVISAALRIDLMEVGELRARETWRCQQQLLVIDSGVEMIGHATIKGNIMRTERVSCSN